MAFASDAGSGAPMSEMNVTPLVDVMLVLLIIFMVTAPTPSFPINIDLPQPVLNPPPPPTDPPPPIRIRIDASGQVFWNEGQVPVTALRNMMESEVQKDVNNQPTLEIDTNADADYGTLAKVLAAAKNAQMLKIGFVKNG